MALERFPGIAFQLQVGEFEPFTLFCDEKGKWNGKRGEELLNSEVNASLSDLNLPEVEVLYVVGLGLGELFFSLSEWLLGSPLRTVIFWEEDLAVIDACVRGPWAKEVLGCRQVHLHHAAEKALWKEGITHLACTFPSNRVEVIGGNETFRKEILKLHMATGAHLTEALYSHKLSKHALMNAQHLPRSVHINEWAGKFKGVPAVISGAGPSLNDDLEVLRGIEDSALIIAGGSAISALTSNGIEPHLNVAIDPNEQEVRCLEKMKLMKSPFIYSHRLHPEVFSLFNAPLGFLTTSSGGTLERWIEKELGIDSKSMDLGDGAFSVTTLGIALALALGCAPIILVGVDLAYTGGRRYAKGVMDEGELSFDALKKRARLAEEQPVWEKGVQGKEVLTLVKWVVESSWISECAKANPTVRFFNATSDGLGFLDIPHVHLEEVIKTECTRTLNLRSRIEELQQSTSLNVTHDAVSALSSRIQGSVDRSLKVCAQMLEELERAEDAPYQPTPMMALYESELSEELIYECVLEDMDGALERLAERGMDHNDRLKWKWNFYRDALLELANFKNGN